MIINTDFKTFYHEFISHFQKVYETCIHENTPISLYDPVHYVLKHQGKQIRPAILAATSLNFKDIPYNDIYPAACCIEMIHNFTLVHDDIMDNDLIRHGEMTVHEKWGVNEAILSGDGLFAMALQLLDHYSTSPALYAKILPVILNAVTKVCEGQAQDMEFEHRQDVSLTEYLEMVEKKTAYLLSVSAKIGAIIAEVEDDVVDLTEKIIRELGIVFQIQDDLLELTSDQTKMGKSLGSDLVKQKKTFPYLYAKENFDKSEWDNFLLKTNAKFIYQHGIDPARKILEKNFVFDRVAEVITLRHGTIQSMIDMLPEGKRDMFNTLVEFVMIRKN